MKPKVLILRAPGTNCDQETAYAFELAGASAEFLHINRLMESPQQIADFQILCIPGGFSYGDDVGAGRILASQFIHHLGDVISEFREAGKLILGICNGFQVLLKTGLLIPQENDVLPATLSWNDRGLYDCRWVNLTAGDSSCVFLRDVQELYLPVAHAEGRFSVRDRAVLQTLATQKQIVLRYALPPAQRNGSTGNEAADVPYPYNPNGSIDHIAGICDPSGHVFGLMPHPERHIHGTQHPRWTREGLQAHPDGLQIFQNAVRYFQ